MKCGELSQSNASAGDKTAAALERAEQLRGEGGDGVGGALGWGWGAATVSRV